MANYFSVRRKTAAAWTAANTVLNAGQLGVETDTFKAKFGDGTTAWNSLAYMYDATGGYRPGGTDVAIADGGTGASSAATALSNLGGAPLASPTFTGTVTVPTTGSGAQEAASKAYVDASQYAGQPSWHGFKVWSFDPAVINSNTIIPTAGVINLVKLWCPAAISITSIYTWVQTAGSGLTNVGFGLYDSSGNLLQSSVNANGATAAAFQGAAGLRTVTISSQAVAAGAAVYVGFWFTGTTLPTLARGTTTNAMTANQATPSLRFATANASLTTTAPNPLTAQSIAAAAWWAAVS